MVPQNACHSPQTNTQNEFQMLLACGLFKLSSLRGESNNKWKSNNESARNTYDLVPGKMDPVFLMPVLWLSNQISSANRRINL